MRNSGHESLKVPGSSQQSGGVFGGLSVGYLERYAFFFLMVKLGG